MPDQPWQCGRRCDCPGPEADGRCPGCRVAPPLPERGLLCIGGPMDGRRVGLTADLTSYQVVRLPPGAQYGSDGALPVEVETVHYDKVRLALLNPTSDWSFGVVVLAFRGLGHGEVLTRLLEGYRPNPE